MTTEYLNQGGVIVIAEERCGTCRFWQLKEAQGYCRRFPPEVCKVTGGTGSIFPPVYEQEWCGEWKERQDE